MNNLVIRLAAIANLFKSQGLRFCFVKFVIYNLAFLAVLRWALFVKYYIRMIHSARQSCHVADNYISSWSMLGK